jgi:hypothetical protein
MKIRRHCRSSILWLFLLWGMPVAAAETPPPSSLPIPAELRSAIAQSARLGRLIYLLDKAAAIGSDALMEHLPGNHAPIGGFLATRDVDASGAEKASFTVIFYTPGNEPRVAYRVRVPFKPGASASVEEAKPPSSPGVELETMIRARSTALAALHGTTQPVNPVVLPASLIGEDGYLVYLLAGTKRPAVAVFGKHYRVLVSPDGATVKRFEPLSKSALEMPLAPPKPDSTTEALVVSQIVTDYPLETHVFTSLLNRVPVVVATRRGGWRVDGDHIEFLGSMQKPAAEPSSAAAIPPTPIPNCQKICSLVAAAQCPRGPRDEGDCLAPCEKSQTGSCADSLRALIDCTGPSPRFTCDPNGFVSAAGCEEQYMTVLRCTSARMRDLSKP